MALEKNVTKDIAIIVLTVFLVFSVIVNVYYYTQNQASSHQDDDLAAFNQEFGNFQIITTARTFSPPVSMYQALKIALTSDNWTSADLQDMTVRINLYYGIFYPNNLTPIGSELKLPTQVTQPQTDYTAAHTDNSTNRYYWQITIDKTTSLGQFHTPPYGLYQIDAQSGEIIPHGYLY